MYRIRELPVLQAEARKAIKEAANCDHPDELIEYFRARQYHYARLGLKAIIQARRLRKLAGFPETRLASDDWSAQPVLREVWSQERRRRARDALIYRERIRSDNF